MSRLETLKRRAHAREPLYAAFGRLGLNEEQLTALVAKQPADMIFVDAQHSPYDDQSLLEFCQLANGMDLPVVLRLRHPREAFLLGHYLDLGLLGVVIPQTESPELVAETIEAFYYPPLGRRSFGPGRAACWSAHSQGHDYAEWWNDHGVLILQLESAAAVQNCRELVQPGVDLLTFGANDLLLDLTRYDAPPFDSFEACRDHVIDACDDLDVKVGRSESPLGWL